ncbi:hypothetical protein K0M31_017971, partial [Melipona bicolor]
MGKVGQVVTRCPVSEWANRRGTTSNDPIPTRNAPVALLFLITNRTFEAFVGGAKWQRNSATKQHSTRVVVPTKPARPYGGPREERSGPRDTLFDRTSFNHDPRSGSRKGKAHERFIRARLGITAAARDPGNFAA